MRQGSQKFSFTLSPMGGTLRPLAARIFSERVKRNSSTVARKLSPWSGAISRWIATDVGAARKKLGTQSFLVTGNSVNQHQRRQSNDSTRSARQMNSCLR